MRYAFNDQPLKEAFGKSSIKIGAQQFHTETVAILSALRLQLAGARCPEIRAAHGAADEILNAHFYGPPQPSDLLGHTAGHEQGAASVAVGIAGMAPIRANRPVDVSEVAKLNPQALRLSELI